MLFEGLALVLFGLATFDTWLTMTRIRRYGNKIELSATIRTLSRWVGPEAATVLTIMVPTLLWVLCAKAFNADWILALLVGGRLRFAWIQVQSLKFEKELVKVCKDLKIYKAGGAKNSPPSTVSGDEPPSSPSPAPDSKDNSNGSN